MACCTTCGTSLQTIQAEKGSSNAPLHGWNTPPVPRNGNQLPGNSLGLNALASSRMHQDKESTQRLYQGWPSHTLTHHATPHVAPCGAQTPKHLLTPEQTLSQNDSSDPARFLLGKIAPHHGAGTCWSGLAKYFLAALQRWILKKICKSLFSVIFCQGISISAAHHTASI